jgi:cation diffusion facilitator CzcD-associated flavoprotein CzcO
VTGATWHAERARWVIDTASGSLTARVLVLGVGALSEPSIPALPGLDSFTGTVFHSARWNHAHDLSGERVAVVGTGASAIQFVPRIVERVDRLHLFQRAAPWVMPHPDRAVTRAEASAVAGAATLPAPVASRRVGRARGHGARADGRAEADGRYGSGRPGASPPAGARSGAAAGADAQTIIFGTGFQVTDPPSASYVRGRGGVLLADAWRRGGMSAYLGTTVAGFPNAFMLTGPNTGLGHSSMAYMIESQIAHVMAALEAMDERAATTIEVRSDVQDAYNDELQRRLAGTVWSSGGCKSWYLDAAGRNTTLWPSFTFRFRHRARRFDPAAYELSRGEVRDRGGGADRSRPPLAEAPRRSTRGYAAAGSAR